ncbi:MAG: hypothetical protein RLY89_1384 [Bacteroidota bacterium]|jgi:hypothetical protein
MKKITLIIMLLPFFVFAQKSSTQKAKLPLIKSVCSDTINGKYQETVFAYDGFNRLIQIVNRIGSLKKSDNGSEHWVLDTTAIQRFGYISNQRTPIFKKNTSYGSNKESKWITGIETYYYKYEHGIRVMDSVFSEQTRDGKTYKDFYKTTYQLTDSTLERLTDRSTRNYPSEYENSYEFHKNIIAEKNAYNQGNPGAWSYYYTFTNFDNKINPFAQLNIAPFLLDERIRFSFKKDELINLNTNFDKEGTEINWHLNNQNNLLRSTMKRPDTNSDATDILSYSYTYNQYLLPVYCSIYIKKVSTGSGITSFRSGFLKHFTFRYK